MKEIPSSRLSRITAEQMMLLARFYDEQLNHLAAEVNIIALLSFFALEGIDITVAEFFFFKKGYNAKVIESGNVRVLSVSKEKIPSKLRAQLKEARQKLIEVLEVGNIESIQEDYRSAQTEVDMLQTKANQLPAHFQVWQPKRVFTEKT